jgi:hypothetical protein
MKTIVASVLTTLAVLLVIGGLGVFAARNAVADLLPVSAMWGHGHGRGHGMARACASLDDDHVSGHAAELHRWVSEELALDETQSVSLTAVTGTLGEWAIDMRPICDMPMDDAPAHVAAAVRFAQATDVALQRFATAFEAFYATLTQAQRAELDGWFTHRHGAHS